MGGDSNRSDNPAFQKLTPLENSAVGVAAGVIEITILQPILYLKNASQQGLRFTLDPRLLYRGLLMSVTNMSVLTGLQFPLTGSVTNAMTGGVARSLSDSEMIAAAAIGGFISGIACGPMELVMIQQQRFGGNIINTPSRLIKSFGAACLSRGLVTSCTRESIFTAGYLGISPAIQRYFREKQGVDSGRAKIFGAVASGVIAATLSHPADTVKSCQQGDVEQKKFGNISNTIKTLQSEGGFIRFYRGWGWRTGRMICAMFIMNECKVRLAPLMFPKYFQE